MMADMEEREEEEMIAKHLSKKNNVRGRMWVPTWSIILGLINEDHVIPVRQPGLWWLELP